MKTLLGWLLLVSSSFGTTCSFSSFDFHFSKSLLQIRLAMCIGACMCLLTTIDSNRSD
jgi:hypothetical protein